MPVRSYRWLLLTLALTGFAVDQASKYGVFRWLYNGGEPAAGSWFRYEPPLGCNVFVLIPGAFRLTAQFTGVEPPASGLRPLQTWSGPTMPYVNKGALFGQRVTDWLGLGPNYKWVDNLFFSAVSLLAAVGILVWGTRPAVARDRWLTTALGLILAGTLGNMYDRMVFDGVRDFFDFHLINWPVFNVADCCLVVGAGLLLLQAVFVPAEPAEPAEKPAAVTAGSGGPVS